jgi:hypothetical protein
MQLEPDSIDIPEVSIIDPVSGYNANIPATKQGYPYWWKMQPMAYESLLELRKQHGIVVDDGIEAFEAQSSER